MNCPKCNAEIQSQSPLKDWRLWVSAFGVMLVCGVVAGALHLPVAAVGAGGGAVIGMMVWSRLAQAKKCPKCG